MPTARRSRRSISAVPASGFATRIGGDGTLLGYGTSNVRPDVERYSAMAHVSYDVSDRLSWFGEVAYSTSDALGTPANGGLGPTGHAIQADNAFLTPAVRTALLATAETERAACAQFSCRT